MAPRPRRPAPACAPRYSPADARRRRRAPRTRSFATSRHRRHDIDALPLPGAHLSGWGCMGAAVAVVIPSWNSARLLPQCLDSLADQERVGEVLVVDNGSADGTPELLRERGV